jgi:hypothetical protein
MKGLRIGSSCAAITCVAGLLTCQELHAQTTAPRATGTGLQMVPVPIPLSAPSQGSAASDPGTAPPGTTSVFNPFANPYAAPLLYSSMLPDQQSQTQGAASQLLNQGSMTPAQMSLLMLATQQPMGIGSGRLSGTRSGPGANPRPGRSEPAAQRWTSRQRGTSAPPGGLAARYFNRNSPHSPYPQNYYNRQARYFP